LFAIRDDRYVHVHSKDVKSHGFQMSQFCNTVPGIVCHIVLGYTKPMWLQARAIIPRGAVLIRSDPTARYNLEDTWVPQHLCRYTEQVQDAKK
jgi:hypothetical protein